MCYKSRNSFFIDLCQNIITRCHDSHHPIFAGLHMTYSTPHLYIRHLKLLNSPIQSDGIFVQYPTIGFITTKLDFEKVKMFKTQTATTLSFVENRITNEKWVENLDPYCRMLNPFKQSLNEIYYFSTDLKNLNILLMFAMDDH